MRSAVLIAGAFVLLLLLLSTRIPPTSTSQEVTDDSPRLPETSSVQNRSPGVSPRVTKRTLRQKQENALLPSMPLAQNGKIPEILRQTKTIAVNCGEDVDMQNCKFFAHALNVRLHGVSVPVFYQEEVLVQSFFVPPRMLYANYVSLRLIESEGRDGMRLYLGGFCFNPEHLDTDSIQLPRWSALEGTGPMETAPTELAKQFADYWFATIKN